MRENMNSPMLPVSTWTPSTSIKNQLDHSPPGSKPYSLALPRPFRSSGTQPSRRTIGPSMQRLTDIDYLTKTYSASQPKLRCYKKNSREPAWNAHSAREDSSKLRRTAIFNRYHIRCLDQGPNQGRSFLVHSRSVDAAPGERSIDIRSVEVMPE